MARWHFRFCLSTCQLSYLTLLWLYGHFWFPSIHGDNKTVLEMSCNILFLFPCVHNIWLCTMHGSYMWGYWIFLLVDGACSEILFELNVSSFIVHRKFQLAIQKLLLLYKIGMIHLMSTHVACSPCSSRMLEFSFLT